MSADEFAVLAARVEELTGRVEELEGRVGHGMSGRRRIGQEIDKLRRIAACARDVFDGKDVYPGDDNLAGHARAMRLAKALNEWDGGKRAWRGRRGGMT